MSSSSDRMYEVLGDVYGLTSELGDYVDGIETGTMKLNGGVKKTMDESLKQLEALLPEAMKYRTATGGDVLDSAKLTLEKARGIISNTSQAA